MSTTATAGQFKALRGEYCNLTTIDGVKKLLTSDGVDLVTIGGETIKYLKRLQEKILELEGKIETLTAGTQGPQGPPGAEGPQGPPGPRGPRSKVEKMSEIGDVDLTGLDNGSILEYSAERKMWVVTNV